MFKHSQIFENDYHGTDGTVSVFQETILRLLCISARPMSRMRITINEAETSFFFLIYAYFGLFIFIIFGFFVIFAE